MGSRYLVTGVQLGMLKAYTNLGEKEETNKVLNEIIEEQCIGHSNENLDDDVILLDLGKRNK